MITALSLILIFLAITTIVSSEVGWTNITLSKRNNIVFENRNQNYGAYSIRAAYNDHMMRALGIMLLIVMAFCSGNLIWKNLFKTSTKPLVVTETEGNIIIPFTEVVIPNEVVPPAPKAEDKIAQATQKFTDPDVVTTTADVPPEQTSVSKPGTTDTPGDGPSGPPSTGSGGTGPIEPEPNTIHTYAEVKPTYPDGYDAMLKYLSKNIRYPEEEKDNGIQGTVYLTFVVSSSGEITDVRELQGVRSGRGLTSEAIRVIKKMPRWNPGMMGGRPVNVRFTLPIKFVLAK